jgi:hypothetical protein
MPSPEFMCAFPASLKRNSATTFWLLRLAASVLLCFLLLSSGSAVLAQNLQAERIKQLEQEMEILKKEKDKAELERAKAEAERKAFDAAFPKSDLKALEGKIKLEETDSIDSQILVHESMTRVAGQIAKALKAAVPNLKKVIIYNERDINALANYLAVRSAVEALTKRYDEVLNRGRLESFTSPLLPIDVVSGTLTSFINLAALLRTDTEIKGKSVSIEEASLVSEVARNLKAQYRDVDVIYPMIYLPGMLSAGSSNTPRILAAFKTLSSKRAQADQAIVSLDALSGEAAKNREKPAQLKTLNEEYEKLTTYVSIIDNKTGLSPLTVLLKAEVLSNNIEEDDCSILYMKVLASGANNKISRNLILGSKLSYKGASIINYILFDKTGAIKLSGTLYDDTGYTRANKKRNNFSEQ